MIAQIKSVLFLTVCVVGLVAGAGMMYLAMSGKVAAAKAAVEQVAAEKAAVEAQRDTLAEAIRSAKEQRKKDQALLARRAAENARQAKETARLRVALYEALQANREWATSTVPKEVQDAFSP